MKNNLSNKIMVTGQELIEDSFKLGIKIIKSGFTPTTILVLWRGGATIGMAIHELMRYKNFQLNHMIIKTSSKSICAGKNKTKKSLINSTIY